MLTAAFFSLQTVLAQLPEAQFRRAIGIDALQAEELVTLEKGTPVVLNLVTTEKQEVVTLGLLRIRDLGPISMKTFRSSFDRNGSGEMKRGGKFGQPPTIDDLQNLVLDKNTVKKLASCEVGRCDINLSAEMITQFREQIDWSAAGAGERATELFREMLLDYVRRYTNSGDAVLGTYDNRRKKFSLTAAHRSFLSGVATFDELAPEFTEYLRRYPHGRLENVNDSMRWSVIDFGLKPTTTISHTATYTRSIDGTEQHFAASKQIYSSRYIDSSLTITALLRVSTSNGVDTYLVFLDRSRSDALEGLLGRLARGTVKQQSADRVRSLLDSIHTRLLALSKEEPGLSSSATSAESSPSERFSSVTRHAAFLVVIGVFLLSMVYLWKYRPVRFDRPTSLARQEAIDNK